MMKNSDEMVKSLFERREQYITEQNKKRKKVMRITTSLAACFIVIVMVAVAAVPTLLNDTNITLPISNGETTQPFTDSKKPTVNSETTKPFTDNDSTTSPIKNEDAQSTEKDHPITDGGMIKISLFNASPKDPDTDYFGEDELHHIDVILKGNRLYEQIPESEYASYGIGKGLRKSDFGELVGTIKEVGHSSEADISVPCSQEPTLAGCEVFFYKPANCEAIIIVRGNEHCSLFRFKYFTEEGNSYSDEYKIFNVLTADDILRIDYRIEIPNGAIIVTKKEGSITNSSELKAFFDITMGLKPYANASALSGDPEWMIKAREEYKKLSNDEQIYIEASVVLKNGLSMPFSYQPNFGTGYVPGHLFLSEENNTIMRQMFQE